jgi:radical SAM superfamily enzyme YgiQ (UPF0313 family)
MKNKKTLIYLADLTHTGPVISSEVFPLGIGLLASYLLTAIPDQVDVKIFKFPSDLSTALEKETPQIMGFSNYSWNCNLSYEYAKKIKQRFPKTVLLFGGPNYGFTEEELDGFWKRYPLLDFYIIQEGERALADLVPKLISCDFDVNFLKHANLPLPNCHYLKDGKLVKEESLPRIKSLDEIPSPYLMGLMDPFFDTKIIPMIHTMRGCPFKCTFCAEGALYYQKVAHHIDLEDELNYIAARVKDTPILYLTDANFGMFKEDMGKARLIADIQKKYGYPKEVIVATGKNKKDRVLETASILGGTMFVTAAMQSTNETILKNIARTNISIDVLQTLAKTTKKNQTNTYGELILGLPGDSLESHSQSLRDLVNMGLSLIRMYQLILLPQTAMNTLESRKTYEMETLYRLMPRSFGQYNLYDETLTAIEYEEVCIANKTMPFEDYLNCRELDLTVEILHNGSTFLEFWFLCDWLGYSWFDLLLSFYKKCKTFSPGLKELYDSFREDNKKGYWNSIEDLEKEVKENWNTFINKTEGTNEMSKAKAKAFFYLQEEIHDLMTEEMKLILQQHDSLDSTMELYLSELKELNQLRKTNVLDSSKTYTKKFNFDFLSLMNISEGEDPHLYKLDYPIEYSFYHDGTQVEMFTSYSDRYGKTSIDALGKILMRSRMTDMFRKIKPVETSP